MRTAEHRRAARPRPIAPQAGLRRRSPERTGLGGQLLVPACRWCISSEGGRDVFSWATSKGSSLYRCCGGTWCWHGAGRSAPVCSTHPCKSFGRRSPLPRRRHPVVGQQVGAADAARASRSAPAGLRRGFGRPWITPTRLSVRGDATVPGRLSCAANDGGPREHEAKTAANRRR